MMNLKHLPKEIICFEIDLGTFRGQFGHYVIPDSWLFEPNTRHQYNTEDLQRVLEILEWLNKNSKQRISKDPEKYAL